MFCHYINVKRVRAGDGWRLKLANVWFSWSPFHPATVHNPARVSPLNATTHYSYLPITHTQRTLGLQTKWNFPPHGETAEVTKQTSNETVSQPVDKALMHNFFPLHLLYSMFPLQMINDWSKSRPWYEYERQTVSYANQTGPLLPIPWFLIFPYIFVWPQRGQEHRTFMNLWGHSVCPCEEICFFLK